jgi:predicted cupin superfamily sugar epimerase
LTAPLRTEEVVRRLRLAPHPEGGYYRETFRSTDVVQLPSGAVRQASTSIYYLLPSGTFSAWHRVDADEVWHHYDGGALVLHRLGLGTVRLDREHPQAVVPAHVWQAAEPADGAVLCGCTVSPAFEFSGFELARAERLAAAYPEQADVIRRLCRS